MIKRGDGMGGWQEVVERRFALAAESGLVKIGLRRLRISESPHSVTIS